MAIHDRIVALVVSGLLFTACNWEESCYHRFVQIDRQQWALSDTLHFVDTLYFENGEIPSCLMLETSLRHSNSYPYEDIYLHTDMTIGEGKATPYGHTFHMVLVNDRHHWSGNGWGSLHTVRSHPMTINLSDRQFCRCKPIEGDPSDTTRLQLPLRIDITSAMSDSILDGCESIGLRLYR